MNYKVVIAVIAGGAAGYLMSVISQQAGGG
jgi:hypothetical protein